MGLWPSLAAHHPATYLIEYFRSDSPKTACLSAQPANRLLKSYAPSSSLPLARKPKIHLCSSPFPRPPTGSAPGTPPLLDPISPSALLRCRSDGAALLLLRHAEHPPRAPAEEARTLGAQELGRQEALRAASPPAPRRPRQGPGATFSSTARGRSVTARLPLPRPRRHRRAAASATRFAAPTRRLPLDGAVSFRRLFGQVSRRRRKSGARNCGWCPHEDHDAQDRGGPRVLAQSDGRVVHPRRLRGRLRRQLAAW